MPTLVLDTNAADSHIADVLSIEISAWSARVSRVRV
jgi:hypothetical protein